ncbi:MAG: hypothetical protein MUO72_02940 [Bacteroidales bacterium]|nr:hypothetical protein [Bacteroidales bacterium]
MSSIIEGYTNDIFISYRQKDNKHEGWVTEFVEHLKGELESTFKEEISVYFDINPHDGLLETHDVDESLKDKLKCLIFIPVISRTYCDPKSFAWEHEFKAFIEQASNDQFGLKIPLQNGNVATRMLPVRIHDLDINDTRLCEATLGGVLRGVEFIYKSAGVNRPLRANEDHPRDNLNKTYYRDQINKVANAIAEIIYSLKYGKTSAVKKSGEDQFKSETYKKRKEWTGRQLNYPKPGKRFIASLLGIICLMCIFIVYRYIIQPHSEKIFAFVPLQNSSNDSSLKVEGDNFIEAVYNKLGSIRGISTISRLQMDQYSTKESLNNLIKESKTDYLMGGSLRREGRDILLWIELITVKDYKRLWSHEYSWDKNRISQISQEVVRVVVENLKKRITTDELYQIEKEPTNNPEALYNYISGTRISNDGLLYYLMGNKMLDSTSIKSALKTYDRAIMLDTSFAEAYAGRAIARSLGFYMGQLDSSHIEKCLKDIEKAQKIKEKLPEAEYALGFYYYYCRNELETALTHFSNASEMAPADYKPLFYMAIVYRKMNEWNKSQQLMRKVISLKPKESLFLTNIGLSYTYLHEYDSALTYHQMAIDGMPGWYAPYDNKIETLILKYGNTTAAWPVFDTAVKKTGDKMTELRIQMLIFDKKYDEALHVAENTIPSDYKINGNKYLDLAQIYGLLNNSAVAAKYVDSSLVSLNTNLISNYFNYEIHSSLGIAYALKGKAEKALEEGKIAIEIAKKNILNEIDSMVELARIYAILGDYGNAFVSIENLLKNPACFSVKLLQLDPVWKPLSARPQYKTLIQKYSRN